MLKNPPTVAELFRLDDLEVIGRRPEDGALLYLFRLDGLLPEEHRLTIDVSSGVARMCPAESEHAIVAETYLDTIEMCLFTALVLSHPCSVASYQMRALYQLYQGIEVRDERARAMREDGDDQPVRDVITACNLKLTPLALVITPIDQATAYQLKPARQETRGGNEEGMHALETSVSTAPGEDQDVQARGAEQSLPAKQKGVAPAP